MPGTIDISPEKLLQMYTRMETIRYFEETVGGLFANGKIPGFLHLYCGEEAVAVGTCACLRDDDYITSTHRGHGHLIAKGGRLDLMMAELFGKRTGYCKGKGGSMHIADLDLGILGANGIVGAGLPIATGAGLACQLQGIDRVAVCFFGDSASNRGTFHESVNMAAIWDLPVVFVCENNGYGISMSQKQHTRIGDIADRSGGFGIPGVVVDGMNVVAVYEAIHEAVERARAGRGPTLVECKTYRYRGHFEGDPQPYRTAAEIQEWRERDPIIRFRSDLMEAGLLTPADVERIAAEVKEEVQRAIRFAEESPLPGLEDAETDVYAESGVFGK